MPSDHLSTIFAALADPTRRAILARLVSGDASVTELAAPFEMSMPAISKHLKVLERAGAKPNGGPAGSRRTRSREWPTGWSTIAVSGSRVSTGWMTICAN